MMYKASLQLQGSTIVISTLTESKAQAVKAVLSALMTGEVDHWVKHEFERDNRDRVIAVEA